MYIQYITSSGEVWVYLCFNYIHGKKQLWILQEFPKTWHPSWNSTREAPSSCGATKRGHCSVCSAMQCDREASPGKNPPPADCRASSSC